MVAWSLAHSILTRLKFDYYLLTIELLPIIYYRDSVAFYWTLLTKTDYPLRWTHTVFKLILKSRTLYLQSVHFDPNYNFWSNIISVLEKCVKKCWCLLEHERDNPTMILWLKTPMDRVLSESGWSLDWKPLKIVLLFPREESALKS